MSSTGARSARRVAGLLGALDWLTTPLLPADYLDLIDPLLSARRLRGRVEAVRPETADCATLVIRPGRGWAGHRPGQHVRLGVEIDGVRHHRTFSLSSAPEPGGGGGRIAVTVKAAANGLVSPHLVRRTRPGTVLDLEPAAGAFTLPAPTPGKLLFVTAGSGITPVMAILRSLTHTVAPCDVAVVHVDRTPGDVAFGAELRGLARAGRISLREHHTAAVGRPTADELIATVLDWRDRSSWACGPAALLDGLQARYATSGVPLEVERFQAATAPTAARAEGGRVSFLRSGRATQAGGATTLLAAGEAAGALLPSGCRMGICRSCVGRLRSGRVRDLRTGEVHGPGQHVQTCVSAAAGPVEIEL